MYAVAVNAVEYRKDGVRADAAPGSIFKIDNEKDFRVLLGAEAIREPNEAEMALYEKQNPDVNFREGFRSSAEILAGAETKVDGSEKNTASAGEIAAQEAAQRASEVDAEKLAQAQEQNRKDSEAAAAQKLADDAAAANKATSEAAARRQEEADAAAASAAAAAKKKKAKKDDDLA